LCQRSTLNTSIFHVSSPYRHKANAQTFQFDSKDLRRFVAIWNNVLSKLKSIIMSRKKRRRNNGAENKRRENSESFHFRTSFGFSLISPFYTLFIFQNLFLPASFKRSFWLVGIKIVRRKDRRKESSTWIERKGSCHFAFSCCVHVALKNVRR